MLVFVGVYFLLMDLILNPFERSINNQHVMKHCLGLEDIIKVPKGTQKGKKNQTNFNYNATVQLFKKSRLF